MNTETQPNPWDDAKTAAAGEGKKRRGRPPRQPRKAPPYFKHAKHLLGDMYRRGQGKSKQAVRLCHKKGKRRQQEKEYIFSTMTLKVYQRQVYYFFRWLDEQGIILKNFQQSLEYVQPYLDWMKAKGMSPYSIKLAGCAILKLFPGKYLGQYSSPARARDEVKRGRRHDLEYFLRLQKNHPLVYMIGLATGLRKKKELFKVKGTSLVEIDGKYYVHTKGKNGLVRDAPIIGDEETVDKVVSMFRQAGEERLFGETGVFGKLPNYDQHVLRSIYAVRIYCAHERPLENLPEEDRYCCSRDYAGVILDKKAMKAASLALGHHRIDVVAYSYLWPMITMPPEIQAHFGIKGRAVRKAKKKAE